MRSVLIYIWCQFQPKAQRNRSVFITNLSAFDGVRTHAMKVLIETSISFTCRRVICKTVFCGLSRYSGVVGVGGGGWEGVTSYMEQLRDVPNRYTFHA